MASFQELINSDKPVLIDFHATWCGPCKTLAPIVQDVKSKMGDKIRILKIDVDKNQELASKLQVQGVPTLMIYKQGQLKWRQSGVLSAHMIERELKKNLEGSI